MLLLLQTFYNDDPNADRFRQVKGQINEVKGIIIQDIGTYTHVPRASTDSEVTLSFLPILHGPHTEKVLIRGEKLDLLVDKTEELSHTASKFKKTVRGYMQNSQPALHPAGANSN